MWWFETITKGFGCKTKGFILIIEAFGCINVLIDNEKQ